MNSLLIAVAAIGMVLVTEIALAFRWIKNELDWLREVLIPWMVRIHNDIQGKQ